MTILHDDTHRTGPMTNIGILRHLFLAAACALPLSAAATAQRGPAPDSPTRTFDTTVARLEARTANDPRLYAELVELVRNNPDVLHSIPRTLRSGTVGSGTSDTLIFSLEDIATPEAQDVLASIASDRRQRGLDRMRSVLALGSQRTPTPSTLDTLWELAGRRDEPAAVSLSDTALLSLGIAGNTLRFHGEPGYDAVRQGLLAKVAQAATSFERSTALRAVGNLHDATLADVVAADLMAPETTVRVAAAHSLAALGDPESAGLLAGLLPGEVRGAVRCAMIQAMRDLPATNATLHTVLAIVRNERHTEARATMVSYLVEHLAEIRQARPVLIQMVHQDPSNQVRMLASSVLRG